MLSDLNIVKGAVAKKDLSPVLKHLLIRNGWVTATNGRLTITTHIPELEGLDVIVPADKFIAAVNTAGSPKFKITDAGRLSISGGKFRALVPLLPETVFPLPTPTGETVDSSGFIEGLNLVYEFMGKDASRLWSCGILFHKGWVYATNNTAIARANVGWSGPSVNVPAFLIDELLRIKKKPVGVQMAHNTVTLKLEDNVWVNSVLLPGGWPNAKALFDRTSFDQLAPVPEELEEAISNIVQFCPDKRLPKIYFRDGAVSTDQGVHSASYVVPNLPDSIWRAEPLLALLSGSKKSPLSCDFSQYPAPCPWRRENGSEGLIIGLRE